MKIYNEELSDVNRYIQNRKHIKLEDKETEFNKLMGKITRFKAVNRKSEFLEIGTGIGWIPILCEKKGISCKGIEISPKLIEYAKNFGRQYDIEPHIELGNIEDFPLGISKYDVIIATSVFEHVEYWRKGLRKVYNALKPGGLLYFFSTNKFSFRSGEFKFPLYGWLPDKWRYRLRIKKQGEDIMKLGIDFNQFTYARLRRFFNELGFTIILDRIDLLDPKSLIIPKPWKKIVLLLLKRFRPLKHIVLCFVQGTQFFCIK